MKSLLVFSLFLTSFIFLFTGPVYSQKKFLEVTRLEKDSTFFIKLSDQEVYKASYRKEDNTYQITSSHTGAIEHALRSSSSTLYSFAKIPFETIEDFKIIQNFFRIASSDSSTRTELTDILIDSSERLSTEVNPYKAEVYMAQFSVGSLLGLLFGYYLAIELAGATWFNAFATPFAVIPMFLMLMGKNPQFLAKMMISKNWGIFSRVSPFITAILLSSAPGCAVYISGLSL